MAAVHAAIGDANKTIDLTSQITNKISLVETLSLIKSGHICILNFELINGPYTFTDGQSIMKLPVRSNTTFSTVVSPHPSLQALTQVDISISAGNRDVNIWWISGTKSHVDYKVTVAFMTND